MNVAIIVIYLLLMLGFGWWGRTRTATAADYLVAGRRLGPVFYTGTMSALVLGSASTVGGVGLGYQYGLGGIWLVVAIGVGVVLLSLLFAGRIQRLRIFTVTQMLTLRYGFEATRVSSIVMAAYTLMLAVTSTSAYAAIFTVLFGVDRWVGVLLGGVVVLLYSSIGGMWSITLTDLVQFVLMTIGIIMLMLPFSLSLAGGWAGLQSRLDASYFDLGSHGGDWIVTQFVIFTFGLLIGQDIWQRVFTARSDEVARWGGVAAGIYTIVYGIAGAVAGMSAAVLLPGIEVRDEVFVALADKALPVGIGGLVMAAGVAAMMSTASGALIACATVTRVDIVPLLAGLVGRRDSAPRDDDAASNTERFFVVGLGLAAILITLAVDDVVAGADDRLRHSRRRTARADPRRAAVEAGHRRRGRRVDGRRHRRRARRDGDLRGARQRADLLRARAVGGDVRRRLAPDAPHRPAGPRGMGAAPGRLTHPGGRGRLSRAPREPVPRDPRSTSSRLHVLSERGRRLSAPARCAQRTPGTQGTQGTAGTHGTHSPTTLTALTALTAPEAASGGRRAAARRSRRGPRRPRPPRPTPPGRAGSARRPRAATRLRTAVS